MEKISLHRGVVYHAGGKEPSGESATSSTAPGSTALDTSEHEGERPPELDVEALIEQAKQDSAGSFALSLSNSGFTYDQVRYVRLSAERERRGEFLQHLTTQQLVSSPTRSPRVSSLRFPGRSEGQHELRATTKEGESTRSLIGKVEQELAQPVSIASSVGVSPSTSVAPSPRHSEADSGTDGESTAGAPTPKNRRKRSTVESIASSRKLQRRASSVLRRRNLVLTGAPLLSTGLKDKEKEKKEKEKDEKTDTSKTPKKELPPTSAAYVRSPPTAFLQPFVVPGGVLPSDEFHNLEVLAEANWASGFYPPSSQMASEAASKPSSNNKNAIPMLGMTMGSPTSPKKASPKKAHRSSEDPHHHHHHPSTDRYLKKKENECFTVTPPRSSLLYSQDEEGSGITEVEEDGRKVLETQLNATIMRSFTAVAPQFRAEYGGLTIPSVEVLHPLDNIVEVDWVELPVEVQHRFLVKHAEEHTTTASGRRISSSSRNGGTGSIPLRSRKVPSPPRSVSRSVHRGRPGLGAGGWGGGRKGKSPPFR